MPAGTQSITVNVPRLAVSLTLSDGIGIQHFHNQYDKIHKSKVSDQSD